jgi:hypothetical protein
MFAVANVLYLFPDEFSSLRGRRLAFARVPPSAVECLLFRHVSPPCWVQSRAKNAPGAGRHIGD